MFDVKNDKQKAYEQKIAKIPPAAKAIIQKAIDKSANDFDKRLKRTTPKSDEAPHIKDTITKKVGDLSAEMSVGNAIRPAAPLEFGHVDARSKKAVKPVPFYVPTAIVENRKHKSRMIRAIGQAVKSLFK